MNKYLQLNLLTKTKSFLLLSILVVLGACQDKDEFTPDPISGDINDFYQDAQGNFGTDIFDVQNDFVFITINNTSVHIPSNSLVYPDGSDVEGMVNIVFEDVLNKGELVIHDLPTMSSGKLLSSEGAMFLSFSQNGQELEIKPGSLVTLRLRDVNAEADVQVYDGYDANDNLDWNISSQAFSLESWSFFWDGKDWIDSGYELYLTNTGWFSIAKEINPSVSDVEQVCAGLPAELFDGSNSDVFLILNDYDTVVPLEMDSQKMLFCADFLNMPQGAEATIVSISSIGALNYYFGMSNATISVDTGDLNIYPNPQTKEQILDLLGMF